MRELEDEIALLELRSEQLIIHLQQLPPGSADAVAARADLETLLHGLEFVKGERDRVLKELGRAA
jgi:hypothetical protein